ncbi:hypothetical protein VCRA2133E348_170079 [Vibrio crassostreae]|nr:hypothetical protein VCRA2133E348_170079 [Vibrio crassostreae]
MNFFMSLIGIWWPLPDLNWGPNDYEPSFSPVINIVTLPRITPKSTSKITSPDYPHEFTDVDDGVDEDDGGNLVRRRRRGYGGKVGGKDRTYI